MKRSMDRFSPRADAKAKGTLLIGTATAGCLVDIPAREPTLTRGLLGHVLDAGIRRFGAVRVGIKWSNPEKAHHFQGRNLYHKH